jgi:hypothetical protein
MKKRLGGGGSIVGTALPSGFLERATRTSIFQSPNWTL